MTLIENPRKKKAKTQQSGNTLLWLAGIVIVLGIIRSLIPTGQALHS